MCSTCAHLRVLPRYVTGGSLRLRLPTKPCPTPDADTPHPRRLRPCRRFRPRPRPCGPRAFPHLRPRWRAHANGLFKPGAAHSGIGKAIKDRIDTSSEGMPVLTNALDELKAVHPVIGGEFIQ